MKEATRMVCADKTEEVRSRGTWAWRNHNPGNVRPGKLSNGHGEVGTSHNFQVYADDETGTTALSSLLSTDYYQDKSIDAAIAQFAPAFENNTAAYQKAVRSAIGATGTTKLRDLNGTQIEKLMKTIMRVEGWQEGTVTYRPWKD